MIRLIIGTLILLFVIIQTVQLRIMLNHYKIPQYLYEGWKQFHGYQGNFEPNRSDIESMFLFHLGTVFIAYGVPSILLIFFGYRATKRYRQIKRQGLQLLHEDGKIEVNKLSKILGIKEKLILKAINKAKRKGAIPAEAEVAQADLRLGESINP